MAIKRHAMLIKAIIALGVIFVGAMVLLAATQTHEEVAGLASATEHLSSTFRYFRWGALILLITFWDNVVDLYGSYRELSAEQIEYAKTLQLRIGAMLVAFDLLVIEGLPSKLIELV